MTQYEWIAQKTNKTARNLVIVLLVGAFALMLIPAAIPTLPFRWVVQLIALCLMTAGIFITTRYLTKMFFYRIVSDGEALDLTVSEASSNGKRQITVCRVGVAGIHRQVILASLEEEKAERSALKKERVKIFDYRPDLRPEKSLLVLVEEGGEELALFLAYEETLASYLAPTDME